MGLFCSTLALALAPGIALALGSAPAPALAPMPLLLLLLLLLSLFALARAGAVAPAPPLNPRSVLKGGHVVTWIFREMCLIFRVVPQECGKGSGSPKP